MASPNTQPIYTKTPETGIVTLITDVAGRDPGSATLPTLFTAGEAGALVESIQVWRLGDEATAREIRFYRKRATDSKAVFCGIHQLSTIATIGTATAGEAATVAAGDFYDEVATAPSVLPGTSKAAWRLEPGESLHVALSGTLTNGVHIIAQGGQYA